MVGAALTCPFCNSALTGVRSTTDERVINSALMGVVRSASDERVVSASQTGVVRSTTDKRVVCPRCGESLPADLAAQLSSEPLPAVTASVPRSPVPGKTKTLLAILAVMATMAVISGVFIWNTREWRRQNDYRSQKKSDPDLQLRGLADVAILGFLPAKCNVLGAVNVADLRKQPLTRRLLEDPPLGALADRILQWTGLSWSDIDHIVLGAEVTGKLPQLFVVVQTRQPYPAGKIATALAPAVPTKHRQKLLVRFPLQPFGEGLVWGHSDQILVFVLGVDAVLTDDLDALPMRPRPGLEGFHAALRTAITERLPPASACWLAGHFDEASGLGEVLALTGRKNAALDVLLQTKTFVVSVQAQEPTLTGHFFTGAAKNTTRLQALLESRRWPEAQSYKVAGPPPDVVDPEAQWVTLQARGDLAAGLASVSKKR